MDIFLIVSGAVLMLAGLAGSVLPFLPGPPLSYVALLLQNFRSERPFSSEFLWTWAGITVAVIMLEYLIPVYGTRRYGGTRYGMWGCTIGLVVGIFLGPAGIIIGPFAGALIGELIGNADSQRALKAALGSFIGFLFSTVLKLIACGVMAYYFIRSIHVSDL